MRPSGGEPVTAKRLVASLARLLLIAPLLFAGRELFAGENDFEIALFAVDSAGNTVEGENSLGLCLSESCSGSQGTCLVTDDQTADFTGGIFQTTMDLSDLTSPPPGDLCLWIQIEGEALEPLSLGSVIWAQWAKVAESLVDAGVTSASIADSAVTTAKIADSSVTAAKISDGTIAAADIASDAVEAAEIATGAVTTTEILDGTITTSDISSSAAITDAQVNNDLTISGGTVNNSVIGGTTAAAGTFTSLTADSATLDVGSGTGTGQPVLTANVNTTSVGNGAGASPTTLMSYSLPANSLSSNGKGVRITAWGTTVNDNNSKQVACSFGSTQLITSSTNTAAFDWVYEAVVIRTGASSQEAIAWGQRATTSASVTRSAPSENLTAAVTISCTGLDSTSGVANEIIQRGLVVEALN